MEESDIVSANVRLLPPDTTIPITDINELVSYLNEVVIYNKDSSYTGYAGQAIVFTLNLSDGTQTEITTYDPFVIIQGVGYRTKGEPCEKLNRFADHLLQQTE